MPREELRFRIGDAFPADDAVARWLSVLAMASNDFFRMFQWVDGAESEGPRLLAYRIQAAAIFEAASHLNETIRNVPEVRSFYAHLSVEAREVGDRVIAAVDRGLTTTSESGQSDTATSRSTIPRCTQRRPSMVKKRSRTP